MRRVSWLRVAPVALLPLLPAGAPAAGAGAADAGAPGPGVYAVVDLGGLEPGGPSGPVAINAAGHVAGTAWVGTAARAFLHDRVAMRDLGVLPGTSQSGASDLSDSGLVVGWSASANQVESRAVLFDGSGARDLGHLGGGSAVAIGVSDGGVVVGSSTTATGERRGFRWRDGDLVDLNDVLPLPAGSWVEDGSRVDDAGRVIGRVHLASGEIAGYWFDGSRVHTVRLAPGDLATVTAFRGGTVVGTSSGGSGGSHAFVWREGTATELPPLPGDACTDARDVDAHGRVVGTSSGCGRGPTRAVLWQAGRAVDLQLLLAPASGWRLRNAMSVNDRGEIAAVALDAEGRGHAVVLVPTRRATVVAGDVREATAAALAGGLPEGESSAAVVAGRDALADAAVAAVLAARRQAPLLLTGRDGLDPRATAALSRHVWRGGTVEVVGGTGAVGAAVEERLVDLGYRVVRHAGADRYDTAARVAVAAGGHGAAVLVSGEAIDAPAAIPLAVQERAALLYTTGGTVPAATRAYLDARPGWPRWALGRAAGAGAEATRLAGADRVETALLVAGRWSPSPAAAVVAPAAGTIDGILAGRLAASAAAPVLLAGGSLPPAVAAWLRDRPLLAGAVAVGALGATAVPADLDAVLGR